MDRELKDQLADEPFICGALTVIGSLAAGVGALAILVLLIAAASTTDAPSIAAYLPAISAIVSGLVLIGIGAVVRDVHAMRVIAEHEAKREVVVHAAVPVVSRSSATAGPTEA